MHTNNLLIITVFLATLFIGGSDVIAQWNGPLYAKAEAGWQWPADSDGITRIPVCWENADVSNSTARGWVHSAISNTWEGAANVSFEGWGSCVSTSRGIRILIADTRSHSLVGKHLDGQRSGMELNFTFKSFSPSCQAQNKIESCVESVAVHEFGHALGFMHEQDDDSCQSEERGSSGWRLTDYDTNSVMNYCNPRWNNDGHLSPRDIQGIQTIYGAKQIVTQGQLFVLDMLDPTRGQIWENVVVDWNGGTGQFFHVDSSSTQATRAWNISVSGRYCYRVWTYTIHANGAALGGYGQGCLDLQGNKTYRLGIGWVSMNPAGYLNLAIQ